MITEFLRTVRMALVALIVVVPLLWWTGIFNRLNVVVPERQVRVDEIECLASQILADARFEPKPIQRKVAEASVRHRDVFKRDICLIFQKGLTMVPPEYKRSAWYVGRRVWYVKNEVSAQLFTAALVLAKEVLTSPLPEGCATHYIRPPRTTWNEDADILKGMHEVAKEPDTTASATRFFCP